MKRKSRDYFEAGCRLIWYLEPRCRLAHVLEGVDRVTQLGDTDFLDGDVILPGFRLQIGDLWDGGQYGHWGRTERRDKSSCWD